MIKRKARKTQHARADDKQFRPRLRFIKDRFCVVSSAHNSNVIHVQFLAERFKDCECETSKRQQGCNPMVVGAACNLSSKNGGKDR